ncbi:hypothetical protein BU24DRAFT_100912 [Aaosphaeria arxii CBS 175.79]|uniref:Uncharacterized protein n=1 Tax=Aaosphaeria arxii CBS 175.79 TaxID=1450172 RepID=A0A6A5XZJ5_9PLEO|nr:uncharacterized protein BU24DRAFT_100912 [Aaosphaeria arxii CBS 175.79]KAF2018622.1 hypothetical protein BU24DRAFT_100912 [Aaosphaeria arxii CBS 175.79]
MKTVPTLCATATCIGASAVGLSFGRENPLEPPSATKRKATPAPRELDRYPMSTTVQTAAITTTTTPTHNTATASATTTTTTPAGLSYSSPIPPPPSSSSSRVPFTTRYSYDGRPQRRLVRRMTSGDTSLQPPSSVINGNYSHSDQEVDDFEPTSRVPSRRSSWIKRLSNISNSQASSRNSSPGPMSPSMSVSNGSMAFSHDGSTAPIIGKRSPSPLPPNKLVKRSSSIRIPLQDPPTSSGSRLPSLRRPATSHQRSATLQQHTVFMDFTARHHPPISEQPVPTKTDGDVQYTQFFTAKVSKEKTLKRRGSLAAGKSLKRIFPDEKHRPTLVLAKSVSPSSSDEVDESSSDDGDSVFLASRPGTPLSFTAVIPSKPTARTSQDSIASRGPASAEITEDAARRRRSFSISDLLSPGLGSGSNAKRQRSLRLPGAKLSRKSSQRTSSAPLPSMEGRQGRQSSTAHGEFTAADASTKRRDLTDPTRVRREISTSAGPTERGNSRNSGSGLRPHSSSSRLPALPLQHAAAMGQSMHQSDGKPYTSPGTNQIPPSPTLAQTGGRPSRHSVAPSEQASTLVGSDNEARGVGSGDEDDADLQSETVFDSLRTGATRSTSGARGPRIETIFDESPPSKVKVTALRDLLPKGTFREHAADGAPGQQSIAEEEESISTPVRTVVPERSINDSPSLSRGQVAPLFPSLIPSSPPDMPKQLSLGRLEWDTRAEDDDDSSKWSIEEEDEDDEEDTSWADFPSHPPATPLVATPVSLGRHNPRMLASGSSPKPSTPQHLSAEYADRDARSSIFDWSEQQPTDKTSGNRTPPRPSTVHGKKDADRRGSRSVGRRAPSGLHARSQSVPVVPDAAGKRSTVVTNKFGTWGVGSKGVTEDWNDDFDFSDRSDGPSPEGAAESHRIDSGTMMMIVPKTIQEQQSNVLANIGLLREWGLLIEELKEQRVRAITLGLFGGPSAGMWEEVDAMIDLADQEAEEDGIPRLTPPSSPGFDEHAFDDVSGASPKHGRGGRRTSGGLTSGLANADLGKNIHLDHQPVSQPNRSQRRSILPPNHDIFVPQSSPIPPKSTYDSSTIVTRPRKDSEAKARYVIESLQKRRSTHEPTEDAPRTPASKKVAFDTATLRRIVPYVNTLTRQVKNTLREAEGLYSGTPGTSPQEPPFSKIFQTEEELAGRMKVMTVM